MPDVVVLASGGINSTVAAVRARSAGKAYLLHADFGQPSSVGQRAAVRAIADAIGAAAGLIELPHVAKIAGVKRSASGKVAIDPKAGPALATVGQVPGLAVALLSAAMHFAYRVGATAVISGASEQANEIEMEAAPGGAQPDHRREFFYLAGMMFEQLQRSRTPISIESPLIDLSRGEIIKLGNRDGAPFGLTYSCRAARDVACGQCPACAARAKAFAAAGLVDPALASQRA